MPENHKALNVIYEARRQARGPAMPRPRSPWLRRILLIGLPALCAVAAAAGLYYHWTESRVKLVEAHVCAALTDFSADADARLKELFVKPGDAVAEGHSLAQLDDAAAKLALAVAEAERTIKEGLLAQAKAQARLVETRAAAPADPRGADVAKLEAGIAQEKVRVAEAELKKAEAEAAARRLALQSLTLTSSVAGAVIRTARRPGEMCRKGETVLTVADDRAGRWVEGFVTERDATRLHVGQRAEVELITGSGNVVEARVEALGLCTSSLGHAASDARTAADGRAPATRLTTEQVWVKLRPLNLSSTPLPGMSARAVIFLK